MSAKESSSDDDKVLCRVCDRIEGILTYRLSAAEAQVYVAAAAAFRTAGQAVHSVSKVAVPDDAW